MLLAMCCMSHCLQFKSTPNPCTHPFPPSLLLYSSFSTNIRSIVLVWFLFCVLVFFSSFFSRSILWSFFLLVQMLLLLLLGTFDIVAVARIFLRYLLFYINFRLCVIHAQCSYCGKNSIRFRSSIFSHFVSFFFWYIFFLCAIPRLFIFVGLVSVMFFFSIPLANMSV